MTDTELAVAELPIHELVELLQECFSIADWHGGDSDECGVLARKVLAKLEFVKVSRLTAPSL